MKKYCVAVLSIVGLMSLATAVIWTSYPDRAEAHCQVPCGIYDDAARIERMKEDATTIGKAVHSITELSGKHEAQATNQATRWIMTKEDHASHIIEVVAEYFLTQKVKPIAPGAEGYDAYLKSLADHHAVMVAAMKTKQTVDSNNVEKLNQAIDALAKHYKKEG
jgi:nickel superoxide dismutase